MDSPETRERFYGMGFVPAPGTRAQYVAFMRSELDKWAKRARTWAERGDAFIYFISGVKVRAPAAAQALIHRVGRE